VPVTEKDTTRKELLNYRPILLMNIDAKFLNTSKLNPIAHPKDHSPKSSGFYPGDGRIVQYIQIHKCDIPY
jgi:hypothetical protein